MWRQVVCRVSLFFGFCLFSAGCSSSESLREGIYPARGTLTVNGEPAEYANIILIPVEQGEDLPRAYATVDAAGEFQLSTKREFDGAKPGEYYVTVSWAKPINPDARELDYGPELLPVKFQDPMKWGKKIVIEATENELEPIDIQI